MTNDAIVLMLAVVAITVLIQTVATIALSIMLVGHFHEGRRVVRVLAAMEEQCVANIDTITKIYHSIL